MRGKKKKRLLVKLLCIVNRRKLRMIYVSCWILTVHRFKENINILHIFQNMKDLLCPKSRSLVNYSDVLLLKCKSITNLFVLIIRWKKEKLFIKASQIFRNSCQITCTLVQLISGTRTYTQSMSEPWSKRNDKPVIVPPSSQVLTHLLSPPFAFSVYRVCLG